MCLFALSEFEKNIRTALINICSLGKKINERLMTHYMEINVEKTSTPYGIRKLLHGRLSQTKDGDLLLTLRFSQEAMVSIPDAFAVDTFVAQLALTEWLRENQLGSENQEDTMGS